MSTTIDNRGNPPQPSREVSGGGGIQTPVYVRNDPQQRIFSDPLTGRKGVSNDARQWDPSFEKRPAGSQSHEKQKENSLNTNPSFVQQAPELNPIDFLVANDDKAILSDKACSYYYAKEALDRTYSSKWGTREHYSTRTLYVTGVAADFFASHLLCQLFSPHGQVEVINFMLYSQGSAFVM